MAKKLYGKDIEPKCAYCAFGESTQDEKTVLCQKKGISEPDGACKKFKYDPLKRSPRKKPQLPEYCAEDFSL